LGETESPVRSTFGAADLLDGSNVRGGFSGIDDAVARLLGDCAAGALVPAAAAADVVGGAEEVCVDAAAGVVVRAWVFTGAVEIGRSA
jgi:hypothetical protein